MTQPMPATLRKAAVLICSLDADSADELLDQMSEGQAERVRAAIMDLGEVDEAEQRTVMAEFLRGGPGKSSRVSGLQADPQPKLPAGEFPASEFADDENETTWDDAEQPFPASPFPTSPGHQATPATHERSPANNDSLSSERSSRVPQLSDFEDLAGLDDESLARLLQSVEPEITLLALAGAGQGMARRVLEPLNVRQSRALQRRMTQMGPMRLTDIDEAQQRMLRVAQRLIADGQVRPPVGIGKLSGGDYGEDH
jgi:hypothetical protein